MNYKLLDCGKFEKLEQFDDVVIRRPAAQASWQRKLPAEIWRNYHARFDQKENSWTKKSELPNFKINNFQFKLKLSPNRQIGVFPEQLTNWRWLEKIVSTTTRPLNILNGFAYTGVSTLFASALPNAVTHIDASSSSVNWAKQNCQLSHLGKNNIRWMVDDILTFLKREIKRGIFYDGVILDPPAFGRGKNGTTWKIGRDFPTLMQLVNELLSETPEFIILSCHDKKFGLVELEHELAKLPKLKNRKIETLNLLIKSEKGNDLPSGNCARWRILA